MRRVALPVCLLALTGAARPADPGLAPFVPRGWVLESVARGDLNHDGRSDAALVLLRDDPALRIKNDGMGEDPIDTNPRRLLVLLGSAAGYRAVASSDSLIPPPGSEESRCLADRMAEGGVTIKRGTLQVAMQNWLSCGSYGVTNRTYSLRLEGARLRLIGYDRLDFMRSSGEGEELSANFLTGRYRRTTGIAVIGEQDGPPRVAWHRFAPRPVYADRISPDECLAVETLSRLC